MGKFQLKSKSSGGLGAQPDMSKKGKSIDMAFKEVNDNPPAQLAKTAKKFGKSAAKKQGIAIALSKARKGK